ncbi:hypothetical protein ABVK25_007087 [Lepraria finkii]|uniref:Zn(2)-C6 fungal-type domain-containing protein n=1 Tax=Lepraria finkii TaxID=1340010 RepID=A0ABR4B3Q7_9LECA
MVYQGKPSAGCVNCRKRKIKCDEATPACSQCINTKRTCPGYVPRFDLVLRDQTKSVRRKAQRKKGDQRLPSLSQSASSEESAPALTVRALSDPGGRSAYDVAENAPSGEAIPRIFNDFPEQQAICAFFLDFVLHPRHPDSVQGHLEHLLPLYQNTTPDSPLSLATSSVALVLSGSSPTRRSDQQLGRTIFGRALRKTSAAIRNPTESKKDETLMAVLLLGLFEKIMASADASKSDMTKMHNAGAAALVMHRGLDNVKTDLAIGLLFSVRSQLVEHAIEEGTSFKRYPDPLCNIFKGLSQNAAARLTSATINIADLRSSAKSALLLSKNTESEQEVNDLLEYAISVDLLVAAWPESLPEDWKAELADGFDYPLDDVPKLAFVYDDKMDIYLDLWVQSIWNQYRSARIKIQTIILDCISWLDTPYEHQWYWRAIYAKTIIQEMADDICGSVPFALGTKMSGGPGDRDGVEFPYVGGQKASEEHRRAASALGGWHLLGPMRSSLRTTCLRDGQKDWIIGQMQRISRIYALQSQKGVREAVSPVDQQMYEQQLQRYEFDCPS